MLNSKHRSLDEEQRIVELGKKVWILNEECSAYIEIDGEIPCIEEVKIHG